MNALAKISTLDWWQRLPLQRLLLGLALFWCLLTLGRLLVVALDTPEMPTALVSSSVENIAEQRQVDIDRVSAWALFGGAVATDEVAVVEDPVLSAAEEAAAETKLALVLEGVILSDDPSRARAVITHQSTQDSYVIGDSLPVGAKVSLRRVLGDRVIIDNRGRLESLLLYDNSDAVAARPAAVERPKPAPKARTTRRRPAPDRQQAESASQQTAARPVSLLGTSTSEQVATLTNTVRISPSLEGGQVVGYTVAPAANAELFERLGLRKGDVLTHVNGIEVGSIGNVLEVYRIINRAEVADFTVVRDGETQSLLLDMEG